KCRSSSDSKERTTKPAARSSTRAGSTSNRRRRWGMARKRASPQCAAERHEAMSILVNKDSRVLFQGITGEFGSLHARACMEYGTPVVAGVTPGRGGQRFEDKVPIFDTVAAAVKAEGADVSCIFVPPPGAADAIVE